MREKLNDSLIRALIDFDFLILDSRVDASTRHFFKTIERESAISSKTFILDPLESVKALKQLIRVLACLEKANGSMLHICTKNSYISRLIDFFVGNNGGAINFKNDFIFKKKSKNSALISIDIKDNKKLHKQLFDKNMYLICEINSIINKNDTGAYKVFNNLDNYKKLVVFAVLLKKAYLLKN